MTFNRRVSAALVAGALFLGGCSDDGDVDVDNVDTEQIEDEVGDAADDVREETVDAWATFRTGFERLVDEASTGDDDAQTELLDECRDVLEELRQDDDPRADQVGELCDKIRDADDESAWDEVREEVDAIDES